MATIGDIEIPIISAMDEGRDAETEEIKPLHHLDSVPVKHEPSVQTITIEAYLNEEVHSASLTLGEQKKEIKRLRTRKKDENPINYRDFKGHLSIEEVDFTDNSDSKIIKEVVITARYFPWPKYFPESEP